MPELSLANLLRLCLREIDSPAVEVVPSLSGARLEGVRAFADFGDEVPLVVLDDSRDGSACQGVLLTHAAFYFSRPQARVPLDAIRDVAKFPDGPRRPGVIAGPDGPVELPQLGASAARDALILAIRAVATFHGGPTLTVPALPSAETPIGSLVGAFLVHRDVSLASELPRQVRRTMVLAAGPLDVVDGEQIFAFVDESGSKGTEGIVVTDRRLLYRRKQDRASVPFDTVTGSRAELSSSEGLLEVATTTEPVVLRLVRRKRAVLPLHTFLEWMAEQVPAEQRYAPALVQHSRADPASLESAASRIHRGDRRPRALLELAGHALEAGALPVEAARDLAVRTVLLSHGLSIGRSMHGGWWVSPLGSADLLFALRQLLGRPFQEAPKGEGQTMAFAFDPRRVETWAGLAGTSPVAKAILDVFGPNALRARPPAITAIRTEVHPFGSRALYNITATTEGHRAGLDEVAGPVFALLDDQLAQVEARLLMLRLLLGPTFGAAQIWGTAGAALESRASQLGADPSQLSAFDVTLPDVPGKKPA